MGLADKKFGKLIPSIDWSIQQMEYPRRKRVSAVRRFTGFHYSTDGSSKVEPVNMIKLAVDIYVRSLAARTPRVMVSTTERDLKPLAANFELALNLIPDEIDLAGTLRRVVTEALFAIGIVKIGLHTVGEALGHDYGEPFVDPITLDDYFLDMTAKDMHLIQYEGNDYWLPLDEVMEDDSFPKKRKSGLQADNDAFIGERGESRAEGISKDGSAEAYRRRIWLRDVWLPDEQMVLTYAVKSKRRLRMVDWEGPERGPYRKLGFSDVPGNLLPLPPMAIWRDLHDLANALFRKLGNQADNEKSVLGFQGDNDEQVESFKAAKDGDGIKYTGTEPKLLRAGGVNPNTLAFEQVVHQMFSYFGGNIDALGGLAPQTETVGQDKLLTESASAQMRDMAGRTTDFVKLIFGDIAHYEWNDPVRERTLEKRIPGVEGLMLPVKWNPKSKQGKLDRFKLDVDVYSLQDDSPSQKLQRLGFIMAQYVVPLMPEIQRIGGQIDAQAILALVAKLADFPELADIVTFVEQNMLPQFKTSPGQQSPAPVANQNASPVQTAPPGGASDILQQVLSQGRSQETPQ